MLLKSAIITAASGSVGGLTVSHNRGGMYMRARTIPTDPASATQVAQRGAMGTLASRWVGILSQAQRDGWKTYADQVPLTNALGDSQFVTPMNMYQRANALRVRAGITPVDDPPLIYTQTDVGGSIPSPSNFSGSTFDLSFDNVTEWAQITGGFLSVLVSTQRNLTINYFKGPYRLAGLVLGDTATPPTSPQSITSPFTYGGLGKVFIGCRPYAADGRVGPLFRSSGEI